MKRLSVTAVAVLFTFIAGLASKAPGQTFKEYPIPTPGSTPQVITLGPDGAMWFTESTGGKIGRIDDNGSITEFFLPNNGTSPSGITSGPDGNLWFMFGDNTVPNANLPMVGRITPSGVITELSNTKFSGTGPITSGPDGNLWFATNPNGGSIIGRVTLAGVETEFPTPTQGETNLAGITAGPDGNVWFTESAGFANSVGYITPTGTMKEFPVPTANAGPTAITSGPDGKLWFTEGNAPSIGTIATGGGGVLTELPGPRGVWGIASAPDGTVWYSLDFPGRVAQITTSGDVTVYEPPTLGSVVRGVAVGLDGSIWFVEQSANQIGRLSVAVPTPCVPDLNTLCLTSQRFSVTADWQTADGKAGKGQAISLTADSGYFWFFNQSNVEMLVKVLNACVDPFNSFWVFSAGLTNVNVTLTVKDSKTGASKVYVNPLNTPFQPIQDTAAFSTCP